MTVLRRWTGATWELVGAVNIDHDHAEADVTDLLTDLAAKVDAATFAEQVQDAVGAMATDSATIDFAYDDTAGTLTATVVGLTSADVTDFAEAVRDRMGATLVGGAGISVVADDPGDTVTITTEVTQAELDAEATTRTNADALLIPLAQKGAANGVATLDGGTKIPVSQLPALAITETFVVNSQAAMLALAAQTGDVAVRTDLSKSFILAGPDPTVLADWQELKTPADVVSSVEGRAGAVTLSDLYQALDADLTAIAALSTTAYGRSLLELANAAGLRTYAGLGTAATQDKVAAGAAGVLDATDPSTTNTRTPTDNTVTTAKVVDNAVTLAKVADIATARLLGRNTAGTGDIEELTAATVKTLLGNVAGTDTIYDAKGDLVGGTGADTAARLAVGANGKVLRADSTQTTGLKWDESTRLIAEVHADASVVNSTSETTLASLTLPGGVVAAGDVLLFEIWADLLNNSGSSVSYLLRAKLGATTIHTTPARNIATAASRSVAAFTMAVMVASITAQRSRLVGQLSGALGAADTFFNTGSTMFLVEGYGAATEDLASDKAFAFSVQLGTANAASDFVLHAASLSLVRKVA